MKNKVTVTIAAVAAAAVVVGLLVGWGGSGDERSDAATVPGGGPNVMRSALVVDAPRCTTLVSPGVTVTVGLNKIGCLDSEGTWVTTAAYETKCQDGRTMAYRKHANSPEVEDVAAFLATKTDKEHDREVPAAGLGHRGPHL